MFEEMTTTVLSARSERILTRWRSRDLDVPLRVEDRRELVKLLEVLAADPAHSHGPLDQ